MRGETTTMSPMRPYLSQSCPNLNSAEITSVCSLEWDGYLPPLRSSAGTVHLDEDYKHWKCLGAPQRMAKAKQAWELIYKLGTTLNGNYPPETMARTPGTPLPRHSLTHFSLLHHLVLFITLNTPLRMDQVFHSNTLTAHMPIWTWRFHSWPHLE